MRAFYESDGGPKGGPGGRDQMDVPADGEEDKET